MDTPLSSTTSHSPPTSGTQKKKKAYEIKDFVFTHFTLEKWDPESVVSEMNKIFQYLNTVSAQYQIERCPTTQKHHVQGMMSLRFRKTIKGVQDLLPINLRFGYLAQTKDHKSADQYTCKPESRVHGPYTYVKPVESRKRRIEYWYGEPGNGKSFAAEQMLVKKYGKMPYQVTKSEASKGTWLADYNDEKGVIMDEVDPRWMGESNWKKILDTRAHTLPSGAGGKTVLWNPETIIMISNNSLPTLFQSEAFINRRIHTVRHITAPRRPELPTTVYQETSNFDFHL